MLSLLFMFDLQLMIFPYSFYQLFLLIEVPLPSMFILFQLLQIMQNFKSLLDPTYLIKFIILPLNESYLFTDKIHNIFMVIEVILEVYLIIELYIGALLEEEGVEDG